MILVSKDFSLLSTGESELFIKEEDLEFLATNKESREEFLRLLERDMVEVNPIIAKGDDLVEAVVTVASPPKVKWGCSHSIKEVGSLV